MRVFNLYSLYYDLIYHNKNYQEEADYINQLIQNYKPNGRTILDLGCGTGRHAFLLSNMNYKVHGIDKSEEMLKHAKNYEIENKLKFTLGDIRTVRLKEKFDVVISLFHVISYQVANVDVNKSFQTAFEHLNDGGLFIFDCWYGPAVLTEKPQIRIKRITKDEFEIIRIAEPEIHPNSNLVDVRYQIFVLNKKKQELKEFRELHKMRYFFKPEIEEFLLRNKFYMKDFKAFMSEDLPGSHSWNVIFIGNKRIL